MELADDIAYGVHDLEDGIALKLINRDQRNEVLNKIRKIDLNWLKNNKLDNSDNNLFCSSSVRKREIGALVHALIISAKFKKLDFESPILRYNVTLQDKSKEILKLLKDIVFKHIINIPEARTIEYQEQQIIGRLFQAISSDPKMFLKTSFQEKWKNASDKEKK
jgi:dGTPase